MLAALSDERLADRVREGDAVAFELLYDRHHRGVLAFCRHMLRSADEAEDAVQHTFISAFNDLQRSGSRELRVKAWLYTIARNRCISVLRARREQAADTIDVSIDRLSDDVQQRADLQALLADIAELPAEQREALVLSEVGDLSHADVAAVIGCEVAKVKSLVFQARSALIERRQGRDTPCTEIREQLATLRGGALRRSQLRHHLAACPGCREYRNDIRRQREMLALALPVIPSLGLRGQVLTALGLGGGGAAGGAGIGGGLGIAAKSGLAKVGIAALVAASGTGTAIVASSGHLPLVGHSAPTATGPAGAGTAGGSGTGGGAGSSAAAAQSGATGAGATHSVTATTKADHHGRSASGTAHGFTPVQGQSNGDAARQFAATRGKGKHKGITKTHHHTRTHVKPVHSHRHAPASTAPVQPAPRTTPRTQTSPTHSTHTSPMPTTTTPSTTTTATPTDTSTATSPPHGGTDGSGGKGGTTSPTLP